MIPQVRDISARIKSAYAWSDSGVDSNHGAIGTSTNRFSLPSGATVGSVLDGLQM